MKKVLITGATGFAGSHLIEFLKEKGTYEIHGTVFGSVSGIEGILTNEGAHELNLLDRDKTFALINQLKPEWIFHLAALSSPSQSFADPRATFTNNIEAQLNVLDGALQLADKPKILIVGSAEEYGQVAAGHLPIDEKVPFNPRSPYAVSKLAQDFLGRQYFLSHQLPIVRVRPFNHIGERQTEAFVLPAFAKQVAMIEAGKQEAVMMVGNLQAKRDFTDVKDMVKAYVLALEKGEAGEVYNLGSGKAVAIQTLLDMLLSKAKTKIEVKVDTTRMRADEVMELTADTHTFMELTGWKATIPLEQTVGRVLDYWRQMVVHSYQ